MPSPLRILQRVLISLRYKRLELFDRDYREAQRWCREGFGLSPAELEARQMQKLRELLQQFHIIGLCTDDAFVDMDSLQHYADLQRLPLLTRTRLQDMWPALQQAHAGRGVYEVRTTGTTGQRVRFLRTAGLTRANEGSYIEMARAMGFHPGMMQIVVWANQEVLGIGPAYFGRFSRLLYPRLVFGGYSADEAEFRRLHRAIMQHRCCEVAGYTGMLASCARALERLGLSVPPGQIGCLCGAAEMMSERDRAVLERVFGTKAYDMYGSREIPKAAWECKHGVLHINARYIPEVVREDGTPVSAAGEAGLLVFTDLFNTATPFIRYQIGDYGTVRRVDDCLCGRRGFALAEILGRSADIVQLPSGTLVSPMLVNRLLFRYPQITAYQLVRNGEQAFTIRYCGEVLSAADAEDIVSSIARVLAGSTVELEHCAALQPNAGGKLSYYVDRREDA